MSNQKTTQLRILDATTIMPGDLLPIVDRDEVTSPTGETKHITAVDFATYIVSGGFVQFSVPYQGLQYANGLSFDQSVAGNTNNRRCYGQIRALGNQFSLFVRGYISSDYTPTSGWRTIFGVGTNNTPTEDYSITMNDSAGIVVYDDHLVGYVKDASGNYAAVQYTNFFTANTEKVFTAGITKDSFGLVTMYVNGLSVGTATGTPSPVGALTNNTVVMGNGRASSNNIKCTIYDAHVFTSLLGDDAVRNMFHRGVDTTDTSLVASYNSNALNAGPTQWLDSVGSNHILLPTEGAKATNPGKRFILSFPVSGVSQYLGDGSVRDVLPAKYVITSCLVESAGKPLLSVGSSAAVAPVSASGTGSWNNNRVSLVSASYGVNPIGLLALGAAHADRSIYVHFSASAAPCTFSFDGYIRN